MSAQPLSDRFSLDAVIAGIADDLTDLRAGRITIEDARTRAELAKQFMNGVRIVINARKYLEANLKQIKSEGAAIDA